MSNVQAVRILCCFLLISILDMQREHGHLNKAVTNCFQLLTMIAMGVYRRLYAINGLFMYIYVSVEAGGYSRVSVLMRFSERSLMT